MRKNTTWMAAAASVAVASFALTSAARASTLAYWTFDTNTANTAAPGVQVPHAPADGLFDGTTPDVSGNNNTLSVWNAGGSGFAYRADHPTLSGAPTNTYSIKNTGGGPASMSIDRNNTSGGGTNGLNSATFPKFTVEASYKPETGGFRTFVGRDARNVVTANTDFAAFYFQLTPQNQLVCSFADVSGIFHTVATANNFGDFYDFSFPSDNEGATGNWLNAAVVSDGTFLTLYVDGAQIAQTDMTGTSANTALAAGVDPSATDDWTSGGWTVGRGLYAGGHGDRAYGFIDNVRISDSALAPSQLLAAVPEPTTITAGLAVIGMLVRRRR